MSNSLSTTQLEAYLDEALPSDEMARIEQELRTSPEIATELASIAGRRDAGIHSLGSIWRRHRLTCPTREQLGSYELGVLESGLANYVTFHLQAIGCRYCNANLADLREQHSTKENDAIQSRRQKYFQSSAGYLSTGK